MITRDDVLKIMGISVVEEVLKDIEKNILLSARDGEREMTYILSDKLEYDEKMEIYTELEKNRFNVTIMANGFNIDIMEKGEGLGASAFPTIHKLIIKW